MHAIFVILKFKHAHLKFRMTTSKHTHTHVRCSHASMGLTQARPNKGIAQFMCCHCISVIDGPTSTSQLSYSPQLDLPEGTPPRFGHTVTAYSVCPSRIHTTTFGGCPVYAFNKDSEKKIAQTTVMEFGELYHVLADFVYILYRKITNSLY